jgi:hypothetical protein
MKRLIGIGVVILLAGFAVTYVALQRRTVADLTKFQMVRPGMTEAEVDSLLVGPSVKGPHTEGASWKSWYGDVSVITVWFNDEGRVTKAERVNVAYSQRK